MRDQLPLVPIGEVCDVIAGQSPKGSAYNKTGDGLPFYQGKKDFSDKWIGDATTWTTEITKRAHAGDILMSVRAPVGPINFAVQECCIGRGLAAIRPTQTLDRDYLFYALLLKQPDISGNEGAVFASISRTQIASITIPLPDLQAQKRIVAILDEAFAGIDAAVANTEKNFANARALFESYLNSKFAEENSDWDKVLLGEVCEFENGDRGENYPNKLALVSDGIPFVNAGSVNNGAIQKDRISYITKERYDLLSRGKFHPGDVLFCLRGSIGKCGVVDEQFDSGAIASSLVIVRPKKECGTPRILPELIHSYFQSDLCARMIESFAGGAAQPNLGAKDLAKFQITVPSTDEQQEIVGRLREFRRETARLQEIFRRKLNALGELKSCVLRKAFAGDLTTEVTEQEVERAVV